MLSSLLRLATLAGTGAGVAARLRRAMVKLAVLFAAGVVIALIVAVAIGYFGAAIYIALAPEIGPAWSAAAVGLLLLVLAAVIGLIARALYSRKRPAAPAASGLGTPLGAAALGASMGAGPDFDIRGTLERNAITVLLAAFIAGMVMNNRR